MPLTIDRYLECTPGVCGGKPRLAGHRITIADVIIMHLRMGMSLEEIAGKYQLLLASLHAAMAYYYGQKDAIDKSIAEDQAFVEAFQRDNPSLLRAKLQALRNG